MKLRTLRIITVLMASHLVAAAPAFTITMPGVSQATAGVAPRLLQPVTIRAIEQSRQGDEYHLDGDVEILFETYTLRAEHAIYHDDTGDVQANGRVVLDGGPHDAHLVAMRAEYNVKNDTGVFYDAVGTLGAVLRGSNVALTTSELLNTYDVLRSDKVVFTRSAFEQVEARLNKE